jgi:uncharacterized protein
MNKVTVYQDAEENLIGFRSEGHSGYAEAGEDIVCAGISVLVINTINSIEKLTDAIPELASDEELGMIFCRIENYKRKDVQLLLQSLSIGLLSIQETYGQEFIKVFFEEV